MVPTHTLYPAHRQSLCNNELVLESDIYGVWRQSRYRDIWIKGLKRLILHNISYLMTESPMVFLLKLMFMSQLWGKKRHFLPSVATDEEKRFVCSWLKLIHDTAVTITHEYRILIITKPICHCLITATLAVLTSVMWWLPRELWCSHQQKAVFAAFLFFLCLIEWLVVSVKYAVNLLVLNQR